MARHAVHLGTDPLVVGRLGRLGAQFDLEWVHEAAAEDPALVVLDLEPADSLTALHRARQRWPTSLIAGYLATPDHERWVAAQRAGADLVANRGALVARLRAPLAEGSGSARRMFPLMPSADVAGRLGLVAQLDTEPVGPVAVYQVDGAISVVADRCPHAGARLSDGELAQRVLTCPLHGSQFDVCTGERLRGPADDDLATYRVGTDGGQVSIDVAGAGRPSR